MFLPGPTALRETTRLPHPRSLWSTYRVVVGGRSHRSRLQIKGGALQNLRGCYRPATYRLHAGISPAVRCTNAFSTNSNFSPIDPEDRARVSSFSWISCSTRSPLPQQSIESGMATQTRERKLSVPGTPITELKGPVGPSFSRPKHARTATGFGPGEVKDVTSSIPEAQREV